jgi:methyl-accepting chemotaxis protein
MKIAHLKIGTRLGMGFALVLLLLAAVALIGMARLQTVGGMTNFLVQDALTKERLVREWTSNSETNTVRTMAVARTPNPADQKFFKDGITAYTNKAADVENRIKASLSDPEAIALFTEINDKRIAYRAARDKALAQKAAGDTEGANKFFLEDMVPMSQSVLGSMRKLEAYQIDAIDKLAAGVNEQYEQGRRALIGLSLTAMLIGICFAAWVTVSITRPMRHAVRIAQTVASGDLSSEIVATSTDETGQLLLALKEMNDSLVHIVGRVREGTGAIATASREIADGNLDLSSRTEEQASALEETAASMEQLTSTVRQNADNARQARQLATSASAVAREGGAVVARVVDTMAAIDASAKKIVEIISVIDGIAFQTNILALNAAVEAARAGEQGRGFAVVAGEVRNLAQRSATAAKEIKTLIGNSVEKVEDGNLLARQAGSTMSNVVDSVQRVTDIMAEISAASVEQSAGIEQVNQAIGQMDSVTQQNAALVEEAAAAADSLQRQAAELEQVVGIFTLEAPTAAPARTPRAVARQSERAPAGHAGAARERNGRWPSGLSLMPSGSRKR